jgi:hypothetical protein
MSFDWGEGLFAAVWFPIESMHPIEKHCDFVAKTAPCCTTQLDNKPRLSSQFCLNSPDASGWTALRLKDG